MVFVTAQMKRVVVLNMYIYSFLLYNSVYTHFYLILRKVTIMSNLFDLNIKKVLENWSIADALREIIANALDETVLAKSPEIKIYKDSDKVWHIRDYGRGLQYVHLTQNENKEKLECNELIGKFGVGLKDALAVFYRKDCKVVIDSKYHHMTIVMEQKAGFNIKTLHVKLDDPIDKSMKGTDFTIYDLSDTDITNAKSMFLIFNKPTLLEKTRYGEVYNCNVAMGGTVYINGVKVASEPNFMFDYNITNVNKQIRKALNRERSNVGRSAYSDTVKNILKSCKSDDVLLPLVNDLQLIMSGANKDETSWVDVASYAANVLNKSGDFVFMTANQRSHLSNQQVEIFEESGKKLVIVTDAVFGKISDEVLTFKNIYDVYADSFEYKFVEYNSLSDAEKRIFSLKDLIIKFVGLQYKICTDIVVSETIRVNELGTSTYGAYDGSKIIIKRCVLSNPVLFCEVLAHELCHHQHGYFDNTRDFENDLSSMLGYTMYHCIKDIADEEDMMIDK